MHILMVTSEWPTAEHPEWVPFLTQQVEFLRQAGVQVTVFPFRGEANPLKYLQAWLRLRRTHNLADFDLIHAQFGQSVLVAWPAPIPLVTTFHGSDVQGFVGKNGRPTRTGQLLKKISWWAAKRSTEAIVVSKKLIPFLPQKKYHVIPCGIDRQKFTPRDRIQARIELGIDQLDEKLILFLGDPQNPIKRYHLAEQAVREANIPNGRFWPIYGVPHDKIPLYMNASDLFLLTSKHEGSPTVIKEALSCGIPIVTTDVGDIQEWLHDSPTSVICQNDTPAEIAKGIQKIFSHPPQTRSTAHLSTLPLLDETILVKKIIAVYQLALQTT